MGMDLSADGRWLAVADRTHSETELWIHVVDLQDGTFRKLIAPGGGLSGGTYAVAFGANGWVLVSAEFEGSGWVQLRRFEPATGQLVVLGEVRQDTMLAASGDRTRLGYAEANISDGRWGRYTFATDAMERREWYENGTSWFNYEIGTNRTGSQFAIPPTAARSSTNDAFVKVATVGTYAGPQPIGVAYHPVENRVYFPWATTSEVKVYDTTTFTEVGSYDFQYTFTNNGNWAFVNGRTRLSIDGSLLMVTVDGGVRFPPDACTARRRRHGRDDVDRHAGDRGARGQHRQWRRARVFDRAVPRTRTGHAHRQPGAVLPGRGFQG
jgi:hypothetical protein